ncbi:MAG: MEKHLA domain-containing protein [Hyphomicrobiaceae bacterium]
MDCPSIANDYQVRHAQNLLSSFRRFVGRPLIAENLTPREAAIDLYKAPFVVVSHDTQSDPILNYGNETALKVWETDWQHFTKLPSRMTAEPMHRAARQRIFEIVERDGFIDGYCGVRISSTGRRFEINDTVVWRVVDENDALIGEAATFADVKYL